ncbi:tetratricopeptide TPR_1 repeat-containing protein [Clostridium sp. CAG:678]|nr:tetratricopeptide TPR_1 repeat-containing protein [Clostridium sp. CAG:678]
MNSNETNSIEKAEKLIFEGNIKESASILQSLAEKYPKDGRIAFDLGKCSAALHDTETAGLFFAKADQLGYKNVSMFNILAAASDINDNTEEAEKYYSKALDAAENDYEILLSKTSLALYCIRHVKYLRADKLAKEMIKQYPKRYNGYHIHFLIEFNKENYDEAQFYLESIQNNFKDNENYLIDCILCSEQKLMPREMIELLNSDEHFIENIPNYTLKKKFNYYHLLNDKEGMNEVFIRLINDYKDKDAAVGLALLLYSKKEYEKSAQVANAIIQKFRNTGGLQFATAIYIQIFNIYHLCDGCPSPENAKLIEKGGNWCMKQVYKTGFPEVYEPIIKSIKDLFNKINDNSEKIKH